MTQQSFSDHVGIDVSKGKLDVYVLPDKVFFSVLNTSDGMKELMEKLPRDAAVLLEATGGYERLASESLDAGGFSVCVINPKLVFHFKLSLNQFSKTDKIDAKVLALFSQARCSDLRYGIYHPTQQKLLDLQRCREQLTKMLTQEKNRLAQTHLQEAKLAHRTIIRALEKQTQALENSIKAIIEANDTYAKQYRWLCSIPGIADSIAMTLITSLPEMGQLSHKALQRLVGIAPLCNDSGQFQGKRFIQGGRQAVRNAIYMAALVSIRYNPTIKAYYQRKVSEGKAKKAALVACMAKVVRIINSVILNQKDYVAPKAI